MPQHQYSVVGRPNYLFFAISMLSYHFSVKIGQFNGQQIALKHKRCFVRPLGHHFPQFVIRNQFFFYLTASVCDLTINPLRPFLIISGATPTG